MRPSRSARVIDPGRSTPSGLWSPPPAHHYAKRGGTVRPGCAETMVLFRSRENEIAGLKPWCVPRRRQNRSLRGRWRGDLDLASANQPSSSDFPSSAPPPWSMVFKFVAAIFFSPWRRSEAPRSLDKSEPTHGRLATLRASRVRVVLTPRSTQIINARDQPTRQPIALRNWRSAIREPALVLQGLQTDNGSFHERVPRCSVKWANNA